MKEKIFYGNVDINSTNQEELLNKLKDVTKIMGYLNIRNINKLSLPLLTSVSESLYIHRNCEVDLPSLISVGESLYVFEYCCLSSLISIGGSLSVNVNCNLPSLISVGESLYVFEDCCLPSLISIGGSLSVNNKSEDLEMQLYPHTIENKWFITEKSSNYIICQDPKNAIYQLSTITVSRRLFLKINNGYKYPDEVFTIDKDIYKIN